MEYIIEVNNLRKRYKKNEVLKGLDMHVQKGDIYGFIGKNGAGKTTTLCILSGLSEASDGEISIFGHSYMELKNKEEFSQIGILIENPGIYDDLTAFENMKMKYLAYGKKDTDSIAHLLDLVGLKEVGRKKVKAFSLGMKQRLGIALALIGEPKILMLDEPTNGLDPQGILEFRDMILNLNKKMELTIIISSHNLEELRKICKNFGIIQDGKIVQELSLEELEVKGNGTITIKTDQIQEAIKILKSKKIESVENQKENVIHISNTTYEVSYINKLLVQSGIDINGIYIPEESLEDYYLSVIEGGLKNA